MSLSHYCFVNSINSESIEKIPFNSELIRTASIFLFISTYRFLISDRLHNTNRPRGLTPYAPTQTNFVEIDRRVFPAPSFAMIFAGEARYASAIFSRQLCPPAPLHNAMSLVRGTIRPGIY